MGDKIYKSKHYLLWTFKELVEFYNANCNDCSDAISYYSLRLPVKLKSTSSKLVTELKMIADAKNVKTFTYY